MRPHPYLRAYMAGIVVPTLFLLVVMTVYACFRFFLGVPVLEMTAERVARVIVFPMAVVPNLWGLWNMLHLRLRSRGGWLSLGLHGSLLPLILIPGGILIGLYRLLDVFTIPLGFALLMAPIGMAVYYLAWKYLVGFLNAEVGVA
jgi:hypothetical protein